MIILQSGDKSVKEVYIPSKYRVYDKNEISPGKARKALKYL
jgi:hypothetical protein